MDPFMNPNSFLDDLDSAGQSKQQQNTMLATKIHIRLHDQKNRCLTTIEGLDEDLDLKRISKAMKRAFSCSSVVVQGKDGEDIIQLQGDHRMAVKEWLLVQQILTEKECKMRVVIHGA